MTKRRLYAIATIVFASQFLLFGIPLGCSKDVKLTAPSTPIDKEYFGMHIHGAGNAGLWPSMPFGAWRLSDAGVTWVDLEIKKNEWNFDLLDNLVKLSAQNNVEVLLPLAHPPQWASARPNEPSAYGRPGMAAEPRDMDDWRRYVRTVAQRYKDKIRYYEIWNEPMASVHYSGTIDTLVQLTHATRQELDSVDPDIKLVSPSFVFDEGLTRLDQYFAKGGGRDVDIVGYHLYILPHKPEAMLPLIAKVQQVMARHDMADKPLWNTESGYLIANRHSGVNALQVGFPKDMPVLSIAHSSNYVARSLILGWAAGVQRFYWYAYDNVAMGFAEDQGRQVKPVAHAYGRVHDWLRGAVVRYCEADAKEVWVCHVSRGGQGRASGDAWIVWNSEDEGTWQPPVVWSAVEIQSLDGRTSALDKKSRSVRIGQSPVLIASEGWRKASTATRARF